MGTESNNVGFAAPKFSGARQVLFFALFLGILGFLQTNVAWGKNSGQKAMQNAISVECVNANQSDPDLFKLVCAEFSKRLQQNYPSARFENEPDRSALRLEIIVHSATQTTLTMQINWRLAGSVGVKGSQLSISIMDRNLDANRRGSLYHRLIAETPMPNPD